MRTDSVSASPVSFSKGETAQGPGPMTNKQGNLELVVSRVPEAVTLHVSMPKFPTVYENAPEPPPEGNLEATGPARLARNLVYDPRRIAHEQIGISPASRLA